MQDSPPNRIINTKYGLSLHELRHSEISRIIKQHSVTRLLDLGCNHGELLQRLARSPTFTLLAGIDKDPEALHHAVSNCNPEPLQSTIRYRREQDLKVLIYEGDLLEKYKQLKGLQVQMVTLVQVIEHLHTDQLSKANSTIFGFLRPPLVVMTTPNRQFNCHFDKTDRFRHWDHKFQWSRQEFREYCQQVSQQYGYQYEISGIGEHVSDLSKGECTQMAVFTLLSSSSLLTQSTHIGAEPKLVQEYLIPCWRSQLSSIMKEQFYMGITVNPFMKFQQLIELLEESYIGQCLGNRLTVNFLKQSIIEFKDTFQWNQEGYERIQNEEEESSSEGWEPIVAEQQENEEMYEVQGQSEGESKWSIQPNFDFDAEDDWTV